MKSKKNPQALPMSSPISDSIQMLVEPSRILPHSLSLEQETRACGIIISQHAECHISLEDFDQRIMLMGDLAGENMEAATPNERQQVNKVRLVVRSHSPSRKALSSLDLFHHSAIRTLPTVPLLGMMVSH
jgi:hypothetical protein